MSLRCGRIQFLVHSPSFPVRMLDFRRLSSEHIGGIIARLSVYILMFSFFLFFFQFHFMLQKERTFEYQINDIVT